MNTHLDIKTNKPAMNIESELRFLPKPKTLKKPFHELKAILYSQKIYGYSEELFTRWTNLRTAAIRLTELITRYYPDPRKPDESLLANCLYSALSSARLEFTNGNYEKEQYQFIACLYAELVQITAISLMVEASSNYFKLFDPLNETVTGIIESANTKNLIWVNSPHGSFQSIHDELLCATRVFSLNDLKNAGLLPKKNTITTH